MSLTVILQVAIGIIFVWILLAVITSAISSWISEWFKWRANILEEAIRNILVDDRLGEQFYTHPLIKALHSEGGTRKPAEIPNRQFASVVFDMLMKAGTKESVVQKNKGIYDNLRATVDKLKQMEENAPAIPAPPPGFWQRVMGLFSKLKKPITTTEPKDLSSISVEVLPNNMSSLAVVLDTLWIDLQHGDEQMGQARKRVETWFDDAMNRLGGAYKRKAQTASLIIGIVLAIVLNADALAIANKLWTEPLVREAVVAQADAFQLPAEQQGQAPQAQQAAEYINQLQGLSLPIGWVPENRPARINVDGTVNKNFTSDWFLKLGGILLSGIAAAQGAPFWFDLMRKLLNFRPGGSAKREDEN